MRTTGFIQIIMAVLLALPFLLLGAAYANLPDEFLVVRTWDQRPLLWARKSLLTVFRVPVIGVVTAAAAELMRRHFETIPGHSARMLLQRLWMTLFVTACVKSFFEGMDLASMAGPRRDGLSVYGGLTIATVAVGLALTVAQLPRAWDILKRRDSWRLTHAERWAAGVIALMYLVFAAVPILFATRRQG